MALVARFEDPRVELAVCRGVRALWVPIVAINAGGAANEALHGQTVGPVLHLAVIGLMAGAYAKVLRPMIVESRQALAKQQSEIRKAHIADLERELGFQ